MQGNTTANVNITGNAAGATAAAQQAAAALTQLQQAAAQLHATLQSGAGFQQAASQMNNAAGAANNLRLSTAGTTREFIVLGHEAITGNFSRIPGSLIVLAERMGSLQTVVRSLTSTWGLASVGALAFVGTVGAIIYKVHELNTAMANIRGGLALTGRSGEAGASSDEIRLWIANLHDSYGVAASDGIKIINVYKDIQTVTLVQAQAFTQLAATIARIKGEDFTKVAEAMAKELEKGGKGAEELAKQFNLSTAAIEKFIAQGNLTGAMEQLLKQLTDAVKESGGAVEKARVQWENFWQTANQGEGFAAMTATPPNVPLPSPRGTEGSNTTNAQGERIVASAPIGSGLDLPQMVTDFRTHLERAVQAANDAGIAISRGPLVRSLQEQQRLWDQSDKTGHTVAYPGESMHGIGLANDLRGPGGQKLTDTQWAQVAPFFEAEGITRRMGYEPWHVEPKGAFETIQAAGGAGAVGRDQGAALRETPAVREARLHDQQQAVKDAEEQYNLQTIAHRHSLEQRVEDARVKYEEFSKVTQLGANSPEARRAYEEMRRFQAELADEGVQKTVAGFKAQQDAARDFATKISDQQKIIAALQAGGMGDTGEYRSAVERLATLKREQTDQNLREGTRGFERQRQYDAADLSAYERMQQQRVSLKKETQAQAYQNDIRYLNQQEAAEKDAINKIMGDERRTAEERKDIYAQLLTIEEQYQAKRAELQEKYIQTVEKEYKAYADSFKKAFDQVGSSIESGLKGLLTARTSRDRANAVHNLWGGVEGAGIDLGMSLLSKGGAAVLSGGTSGGKGLGEFLGDRFVQFITNQIFGNSMLTAIAGNTAATAAATTAGAATGAAGSIAGGGISAAGSIVSGGAKGGFFGWLASLLPFEHGGIVPSAAGGWRVPDLGGATPALLHSREMVLPERIAGWVEKAAMSGSEGGDNHLHLHAAVMDGPAMDRWYKGVVSRNPSAVRDLFRQNGITPRSF